MSIPCFCLNSLCVSSNLQLKCRYETQVLYYRISYGRYFPYSEDAGILLLKRQNRNRKLWYDLNLNCSSLSWRSTNKLYSTCRWYFHLNFHGFYFIDNSCTRMHYNVVLLNISSCLLHDNIYYLQLSFVNRSSYI